jgi:hypothetical protein
MVPEKVPGVISYARIEWNGTAGKWSDERKGIWQMPYGACTGRGDFSPYTTGSQ